jgi:hypothetical protein
MMDFVFLQVIKFHTPIVEPRVIARCDVGHRSWRCKIG